VVELLGFSHTMPDGACHGRCCALACCRHPSLVVMWLTADGAMLTPLLVKETEQASAAPLVVVRPGHLVCQSPSLAGVLGLQGSPFLTYTS
jgi:hypothetical protein